MTDEDALNLLDSVMRALDLRIVVAEQWAHELALKVPTEASIHEADHARGIVKGFRMARSDVGLVREQVRKNTSEMP